MKKTTTLICVLVALVWYAPQRAEAVDLGKIMPMGDSITEGYWSFDTSGYRLPLYNLLTARGDTFQFVGSNTSYPSTLPSNQQHHEGHSGYLIGPDSTSDRQGMTLDQNLASWIGPSAANPDRILLMIGSNDINLGYDMSNAPAHLSGLITDIYSYRPNVKLYVASIIPIGNDTT